MKNTHRPPRYFSCATAVVALAIIAGTTSGQVLTEDIRVFAIDGMESDYLGECVSIHGGLIIAGAHNHDVVRYLSGAAYVFDATNGDFVRKLVPDDAATNDRFGTAVAIENGTAVVAAELSVSGRGAVYVFDARTGEQLHKLRPNDDNGQIQFGRSVAIDNGVVAIGAHLAGTDAGAVYCFDANTGEQLRRLLPLDSAPHSHFGWSIDIDGGIVAVGAVRDMEHGGHAGAAYLFDAATGTQLRKLVPDDIAINDDFGYSIAIDNGTVAVGSWKGDSSTNFGAAYLFDAATGKQTFRLLPVDVPDVQGQFGSTIAIDGDRVLVGKRHDSFHGYRSGTAFLFDVSTGAQLAEVRASDGEAGDTFAHWVAIENRTIVVGASFDDANAEDSGSVYIFRDGCLADLKDDSVLDLADLSAFISGFISQNPITDLAFPSGTFDLADINAFVTVFVAGCP